MNESIIIVAVVIIVGVNFTIPAHSRTINSANFCSNKSEFTDNVVFDTECRVVAYSLACSASFSIRLFIYLLRTTFYSENFSREFFANNGIQSLQPYRELYPKCELKTIPL